MTVENINKTMNNHCVIYLKIIVVLILLSHFSFAQKNEHQLTFGMHFAPALSTIIQHPSVKSIGGFDVRPKGGFIAGFNFQYQVKPKIALCANLNYESKGFIINYNNTLNEYNGESYSTLSVTYIMDYITLPLTAKLKLNTKKGDFFTNLGISPAYLFRYGTTLDAYRKVRVPNSFNLGCFLVTGFGVNIPMNQRWQFSMEVRNNIRLGRFNSVKNNLTESLALLFGLGYKI